MGNRYILICFIFSFFISILSGQDVLNKDSLLRLLPLKKDTNLVLLYISIGQQYEGTKKDSAKYYYKKAGELSERLNYKRGVIKYITNVTYVLNLEEKFQEALTLNKKSIQYAKELNDDYLIAAGYANTGSTYQYLEKLDTAIIYYFRSIEYLLKTKNETRLCIIYSNIGALYENLGQNELSLKYNLESERIARKFKLKNELAIALISKTTSLSNLRRFSESDRAINESLRLSKELNNDYFTMVNLSNKCHVLMHLFRSLEIKPYASEALKLAEKYGDEEGKINALIGLSDYYMHNMQLDLANKHIDIALQIAKKNEAIEYLKKVAMAKANISAARHDFEGYHRYAMLHDSLETVLQLEKTNKTIIELTTKYESVKKNLEIQKLSEQSKKRLWLSIAFGICFIAFGGFAYFQFISFKNRKKILELEQDKALSEERLRIAQDMHDDVGTGLSRIRYIINSIKMGETPNLNGLLKVTEISDDTITKMSEIIWALNKTNQSVEELLYFIRSQAGEMVENANINFEYKLPENIPVHSFGWMRNRNTYLLVKETINNAIKHAQAKTIKLEFEIKDKFLSIQVSDDGIGFDTSMTSKGNGLNNYRKRIEKLGGTYSLSSELSKGTVLVYLIPII